MRLSMVATYATAVTTSALILLIGAIADRILDDRAVGGALIGATVAVIVLRAALAAAGPLITIRAQGVLESSLRTKVYEHILRMGAPLRSRAQTGELVSTATEATELAATYHATFLGPIIASMTVPILVIVAIAIFIDSWSALWLFLAIPVIPGMVHGFQTRFQAVSDSFRETANALAARFLDALQGLTTLKLFNRGRAHGEVLARATEDLRKAIMRLLAGNQIVLFIVDTLFSLGMITLAAALAMLRLRGGAITPGEAIALVLLGLQLTEPLDKVGQFFYVGMSGMAAGKEVRGLLARPAAVIDADDARAPSEADTSIAFEDVRFAYDTGPEVLRGVSFAVEPGETAALVGPSGAGKTTIAGLLQRQIVPGGGTIRVGGVDVEHVPADWVRAQIAVVAQTTYLFTGSLAENLRVADPDASDDALWAALDDANLASFVRSLPDGLDTAVGERGLTLSGGQAQRVAIARAFLRRAPIIVLDEPTSNVDVESEAAILASLERLTADRTVLVIAHRLSTVREADRIIVLEAGVVTEHGTHDELVSAGGHYAAAIARAGEGVSA